MGGHTRMLQLQCRTGAGVGRVVSRQREACCAILSCHGLTNSLTHKWLSVLQHGCSCYLSCLPLLRWKVCLLSNHTTSKCQKHFKDLKSLVQWFSKCGAWGHTLFSKTWNPNNPNSADYKISVTKVVFKVISFLHCYDLLHIQYSKTEGLMTLTLVFKAVIFLITASFPLNV